jgi:hypothetical protein
MGTDVAAFNDNRYGAGGAADAAVNSRMTRYFSRVNPHRP